MLGNSGLLSIQGEPELFYYFNRYPKQAAISYFYFLKLISFGQSLIPLLVIFKTEWLMHEKYTSKHILHCQKVGFSHILHLSFIDLMILFCEMYLFSLEALMQIYHKTFLFVILCENNIFCYTFLYIYYTFYILKKSYLWKFIFSTDYL